MSLGDILKEANKVKSRIEEEMDDYSIMPDDETEVDDNEPVED